MKRIPFYPILFSIYPGLTLAAHNLSEIEAIGALRTVLVSFLLGCITLITARWLLKDWLKAAGVTTLGLVLFFSYGHLYHFLELNPIGALNLGRHRILIFVFIVLYIIGVWILTRKIKDMVPLTQALNAASIVLIIMPLIQSADYISKATMAISTTNVDTETQTVLTPEDPDVLPDIYLIILDSYTRGDTLLNELNFDNSDFLDRLRQMGFYVADCSRSNYGYTEASLTSMLNMAYLPELSTRLEELGLNSTDIIPLLKQNFVRQQLEAIGYQTIAFETGYAWSSLSDADIYLQLGNDSMAVQSLTPFESMLIKTTALLVLIDLDIKIAHQSLYDVNFPFHQHIDRQHFILDKLPQIPALPGAKFVFAHIMIPHMPYVFTAIGDIQTDPGYYSGINGDPTTWDYRVKGYLSGVQFINSQILPVLQKILDTSKTPPIIILMGDHGLIDSKFQNLNAIYIPGDGAKLFYSTITPVNTFRLIFNEFYGTNYDLLPDESYGGNPKRLMPETSPACMP